MPEPMPEPTPDPMPEPSGEAVVQSVPQVGAEEAPAVAPPAEPNPDGVAVSGGGLDQPVETLETPSPQPLPAGPIPTEESPGGLGPAAVSE
jgi:hypothetical protein